MSMTQAVLVHDFAEKFANELEDAARSSYGQLTGEQMARCASDVLRIDMRLTDVQAAVQQLPKELQNILRSAWGSPKSVVNAQERIARVRSFV